MIRFHKDTFDTQFKTFSLVALSIAYLNIILFNPWDATPGNERVAVVALSHIFIWIILFLKESYSYPRKLKIFVRIVLIFTLFKIASLSIHGLLKSYRDDIKTYSEIERLGNSFFRTGKPTICMLKIPFWPAVRSLAAPTLYMNKKITNDAGDAFLKNSNIVVTPADYSFINDSFIYYKKIKIKEKEYSLYISKS